MKRLYSPWRSKYVAAFSEQETSDKECILCKVSQSNDDDDNLIVTRGKLCYVILNLYPYNSGHVMVVPHRHTPDLTDLTNEEALELMSLLKDMTVCLRRVMKPDGFNIGSNIGRTAGAGIVGHVHFHLVPRWEGDTNFMPTLGETKVISVDLKDTLAKLRAAL